MIAPPPFDPDKPHEVADAPAFDPDAPHSVVPSNYNVGGSTMFASQYIPGGDYVVAGEGYLADKITHPVQTAKALYNATTGGDESDDGLTSFDDELKSLRAEKAAYSKKNPVTAQVMSLLGGVTNPVTNYALAKVGAAIPGAGTVAKYTRFGTQGAAGGALAGAGNLQGDDGGTPTIAQAVKQELIDTGIGTLGGVAIPPVAKAIGWAGSKVARGAEILWDKLPHTQNSAAGRALAKTIADDGLTPDILEANRARLGPGSNVVDTAGMQDPASGVWLGGKNTYRAADALANSPGPTQDLAERVLKPRPAQAGVDVIDSGQRNLAGGREYHGTFDALTKQQSDEATPHFQSAFKANKSIGSKRIDSILTTPAGKEALDYAAGRMQNRLSKMAVPDPELTDQLNDLVQIGQADPVKGGVASGLKLETHDLIRQDLGQQLAKKRLQVAMGQAKKSEATDLADLYHDYRNELIKNDVTARAGPNSLKVGGGDYENGLKKFAGPAQAKEAMEAGRDFMKGDRQITSREFADMSPGEKDVFRLGAAHTIQNAIEQTGTVPPALKNILHPASKQRALMAEIFPNFRAFLNDVAAVVRKGQSTRMIGGSDTAARLNNAPDLGGDLAGAAVDLGMGNHMAAAKGLLGGVGKWLTKPSAGAQAEYGRLLLDPSAHGEAVDILRQRNALPPSLRARVGSGNPLGDYAAGPRNLLDAKRAAVRARNLLRP